MALCSSCQNIVPQSAVRCPVCGNAPGISADEFIASLDPSAEEFTDFGVSDAGVTAPNGRVFTPPPLPGVPTEGFTDDEPTRIPARRGSAAAAAPMVPTITGDVEADDREEIVRTVRAISNRLDADIRIGRRAGHHFFTFAAPLAAAALVVLGTYGAYSFADLGRPTFIAVEQGAQPGTLAFGEEQSAAAQRSADAVAAQVNEVAAINCTVPTAANAIALSPTRLVTNAGAITNDANPVIRFADNTTRTGTVIGLDRRADIAVIEIAPVAGIGTMQWGVADQIFANPQVVVVERFGAAINGTPAIVDEIDGVIGLVNSFGFSGASFRPGSAVLNGEGFVIGMVDETGRSAIGGAELSAAYGRVIARPSPPSTGCPGETSGATEADDGSGAEATG